MLGIGEYDLEKTIQVFREICFIKPIKDDGVEYLSETVYGVPIRRETEYGGFRINIAGKLHSAKIFLQIDVGFGDVVFPSPAKINYPVFLDFEEPVLNAYTKYSVVAEKFEAIVRNGIANSRIKDFYDIWVLKNSFQFDPEVLKEAIFKTFKRRKSQIPNRIPVAFTAKFFNDPQKNSQWNAFVRKTKAETENRSFSQIIYEIYEFIGSVIIFEQKFK